MANAGTGLAIATTEDAVVSAASEPATGEVTVAVLASEDAFELAGAVDVLAEEDALTVSSDAVETAEVANAFAIRVRNAGAKGAKAATHLQPLAAHEAMVAGVDRASASDDNNAVAVGGQVAALRSVEESVDVDVMVDSVDAETKRAAGSIVGSRS